MAALDDRGALLGTAWFPANPTGNGELLAWLRSFGEVVLVGVEGTGCYGAGLARPLHRSGVAVVEVDRPNRADRRRRGKSDTLDARPPTQAPRQVDPRPGTGTPKRSECFAPLVNQRTRLGPKRSTRSARWSARHPDERRERLRSLC